MAINADGSVGYMVNEGNDGTDGYQVEYGHVDVMRLSDFQKLPGSISLGDTTSFNTYPYTGRLAASHDGSLLAATTDHGLSVVRVAGQGSGPSMGSILRSSVFSSAQPNRKSILEFYNAGSFAGSVRVTLADPATGKNLVQWESPAIATGSTLQLPVSIIEAAAAPYIKPDFYIAKIQASIGGTFKHLLLGTAPDTVSQTITNLSVCDTGNISAPSVLTSVNSSIAGVSYPSYVTIGNTSAEAASVELGIYDTRSGTPNGRYTSPIIAGGAGLTLSVAELERAASITPSAYFPTYVIKFENSFTGYLQHLILQPQLNLFTDMTPSCALP